MYNYRQIQPRSPRLGYLLYGWEIICCSETREVDNSSHLHSFLIQSFLNTFLRSNLVEPFIGENHSLCIQWNLGLDEISPMEHRCLSSLLQVFTTRMTCSQWIMSFQIYHILRTHTTYTKLTWYTTIFDLDSSSAGLGLLVTIRKSITLRSSAPPPAGAFSIVAHPGH